MTEDEAAGETSDHDPAKHRLQRQDAKSRKTFKIKRQKTKTTSMRHLISRRGLQDQSDTEMGGFHEGSPTHGPLSSAFGPDAQTLQLRRTGAGAPIARSVETIPEAVEVKVSLNLKKQYLFFCSLQHFLYDLLMLEKAQPKQGYAIFCLLVLQYYVYLLLAAYICFASKHNAWKKGLPHRIAF